MGFGLGPGLGFGLEFGLGLGFGSRRRFTSDVRRCAVGTSGMSSGFLSRGRGRGRGRGRIRVRVSVRVQVRARVRDRVRVGVRALPTFFIEAPSHLRSLPELRRRRKLVPRTASC